MCGIKKRYNLNKEAKVGDRIICPSCNTLFVKEHYQQVFCKTKGGTKCKDKYWNTVTPNKRNNTTRVSRKNIYVDTVMLQKEATIDRLDRQARQLGFPNHEARENYVDQYDGSWDAHCCHVENCEWCGMKPEFCECDNF